MDPTSQPQLGSTQQTEPPAIPAAPPEPLPPSLPGPLASTQPSAYQPLQAPVYQEPLQQAAQPAEPAPDNTGPPASTNEEIVDPAIAAGDHEILVIRRHPFGLVAIYLQALIAVAAALGLIFFVVSSTVTGDNRTRILGYVMIGSIAFIAFIALYLIIATFIYRQSRWIITDDSIQQKLQRGLFSHQSSELSMANIEDVTADQRGILAELFGFGTLKCETAGELPYFHFIYCPTPDKYAKIILAARQRFINESPEEAKRANDLLNVPGGFRR